jgi:hypothetical protein
MSFGGSNNGERRGTSRNPAITQNSGSGSTAPFTPRAASSSVLLAGLMGMRPQNNPALNTGFTTGGQPGLGRRPALQKRVGLGGL